MRAALLLVDLQRDFLARPGLDLPAQTVVARAASLLSGFRDARQPVVHSHTVVRPDGVDRMPHWKHVNKWACVDGTEGVLPPEDLAPLSDEAVFRKTFFSAFGSGGLADHLQELSIQRLVVAGLYTHGCIRATVLDAYQAGFDVWVPSDGVASYDPLHGAATREYLDGRACRFLSADEILQRIGASVGNKRNSEVALPLAYLNGEWIPAAGHPVETRRNPSIWSEQIARIPIGQPSDVGHAVTAAARGRHGWAECPIEERTAAVRDWAKEIDRRRDDFIHLLGREIGKPPAEAAGEIDYALALMDTCVRHAESDVTEWLASTVSVRRRPRGVAGIITPWNNPLALPVGKIAPALLWGNSVVWKPATESPRVAMTLMESALAAGLSPGCISMIFGGAITGQAMLAHPAIRTISFTGSDKAGRQIAMACAASGKHLQAELGGNNAALVTFECDVEAAALELAAAAYSFSGQRCTAIRRVIVMREIADQFADAFVQAARALTIGDPADPHTRVGPLVSLAAQQRIGRTVASAVEDGVDVLCGGRIPPGYEHGCWYEPTVLRGLPQTAPAVQEESFGPVVVLSEVNDFEQGICLMNDVKQGLVAVLHSTDAEEQQRFLQTAEAGILRINRAAAPVHPNAPFGGWKSSGIGPPEHGIWDREMYTRPQALYVRGED